MLSVEEAFSPGPSNKEQFGPDGGSFRNSGDYSKSSCTMRREPCEEVKLTPGSSRGDHRRYRLRRGLRRWNQDVELRGLRVKRAVMVTFTSAPDQVDEMPGRMRDFWHAVEHKWGIQTRFAWMELHKSRAVHYHAFWLNPPPAWKINLWQWITDAWGLGHVHTKYISGHQWRDRGVEYATSYTKKHGGKAYQQDYDWAPTGLRTFMTQRLAFSMRALDEHRTQYAWRWIRGHADMFGEEPDQLVADVRFIHRPIAASSADPVPPLRKWCDLATRAPGAGGRRSRVPAIYRQRLSWSSP